MKSLATSAAIDGVYNEGTEHIIIDVNGSVLSTGINATSFLLLLTCLHSATTDVL